MRPKPLSEQVAVLVGAAGPIGQATARVLARRGVRLVLAATDPEGLAAAAGAARAAGAEVETVALKGTDRAALEHVADRAEARFGGFDTWIHVTAGPLVARLEDTPEETARRLFETTYWALVHGSLVAVGRVRRRARVGSSACLVHVGSVLGERALPYLGHYAAGQHAVRAFTDALRMEVEAERLPLAVVLVKASPASAIGSVGPRYAPEAVARAVAAVAAQPTREVTVGAGGRALALAGLLAPRLTDKVLEARLPRAVPSAPVQASAAPSSGEDPSSGEGPAGEAGRAGRRASAYTWMRLNPIPVLSGAVLLGLGAYLARRK